MTRELSLTSKVALHENKVRSLSEFIALQGSGARGVSGTGGSRFNVRRLRDSAKFASR